jgi:hypothetical protein
VVRCLRAGRLEAGREGRRRASQLERLKQRFAFDISRHFRLTLTPAKLLRGPVISEAHPARAHAMFDVRPRSVFAEHRTEVEAGRLGLHGEVLLLFVRNNVCPRGWQDLETAGGTVNRSSSAGSGDSKTVPTEVD